MPTKMTSRIRRIPSLDTRCRYGLGFHLWEGHAAQRDLGGLRKDGDEYYLNLCGTPPRGGPDCHDVRLPAHVSFDRPQLVPIITTANGAKMLHRGHDDIVFLIQNLHLLTTPPVSKRLQP